MVLLDKIRLQRRRALAMAFFSSFVVFLCLFLANLFISAFILSVFRGCGIGVVIFTVAYVLCRSSFSMCVHIMLDDNRHCWEQGSLFSHDCELLQSKQVTEDKEHRAEIQTILPFLMTDIHQLFFDIKWYCQPYKIEMKLKYRPTTLRATVVVVNCGYVSSATH